MTAALAWVGANARPLLALAAALCFVAPGLSTTLRPFLPLNVVLVLGLAMARIELLAAARDALRLQAAASLVGIVLALVPASALAYLGSARALGFGADLTGALIYLAAAPPIASAGGLCFILGLDARRAIEVTIAATLLTPILGPLTVEILLPGGTPLSPAALGRYLALMIAGGVALAVAIRGLAGPETVARNPRVLDGLATLALIGMVLPLFAGVPALVRSEPVLAAGLLTVAVAANLGVNLAIRAALAGRMGPERAGAYGLLFGNRTIAIYAAALPHDPRFALFVALYQLPILLTPMLLPRRATN
ncbi:hypothetical protein [Amaricoccus sp.]|uniref:hypothetical protein n=1 Tax=Amaricoccus sp. TaxID=1872485 RepID=UPI001B679224|nr:hypothetical protein [Amaricoccus sp.]MBP7242188.1 hypothetical protein [Amaricoccus sp.]